MQFSILALATLASTALAAPSLMPRQAQMWTIRSFTRDCTDPNICTYKFNVDQNNGNVQPCTVVNTGSPATTQSWYGVSCQESSDWQASWGWDYQNDFTVLTVVNKPAALQAYFGYNHPNTATSYADVGPNAVESS